MKNLFIGIDFSKKKFDASVVDGSDASVALHEEFENTTEGCKALLSWVARQTAREKSEWLFCGEHTGQYCVLVSEFLARKEYDLWLENPLQIKRSMGVRREKNDRADSRVIAQYACRFRDNARRFHLPDASLDALRTYMAFRSRLVKSKQVLLVAAGELRASRGRSAAENYVYEQSYDEVEQLNQRIKEVERHMQEVVKKNDALQENYTLVTSVKGIGAINAISILAATNNFTRFERSRQFACYSGVAPFERSSGTSIHSGAHVSPLANKQLKTLLTSAARSAVRFDPVLKAYYARKLAEGKKDFVIINNVRSKLIDRIFAVVRTKQLFVDNYQHPLKKAA
jgi:transposase